MVAAVRFEPTTCRVWTGRSNQLSYAAIFVVVAGAGFEPHDLRVMSPTSYQTAPPRDVLYHNNILWLFCQIILSNFFNNFSTVLTSPFIKQQYSQTPWPQSYKKLSLDHVIKQQYSQTVTDSAPAIRWLDHIMKQQYSQTALSTSSFALSLDHIMKQQYSQTKVRR